MPRILIVEDNESLRMLIEAVLEQQGFTVVPVTNGEEAFQLLRKDAHFDALMSDILMPEMDGLHLISLVRRHFPTIPIIITSAYVYRLQQARTLGAAQFLHKPFSNSQLVDVVRMVLQPPAAAAV
jgi:CheY-like chemotaxis protein